MLAIAFTSAGVLLGGCDQPTSPTTRAESAVGLVAEQNGGPVERDVPILTFDLARQAGTSQLVRTPNGVNFRLTVTDLEPGHAYTLWIVPFNEPQLCGAPTPVSLCGGDDVGNDAAKPDMMYAAGRIASGIGTATFAGRLSVGDTGGSVNAPVGLPAYGLLDPHGAEIQFFVHHHGPKLPEFMPDMIQTVAGGCTDAGIPAAGADSPFNNYTGPEYGRRGPNTCTTLYFAAHKP